MFVALGGGAGALFRSFPKVWSALTPAGHRFHCVTRFPPDARATSFQVTIVCVLIPHPDPEFFVRFSSRVCPTTKIKQDRVSILQSRLLSGFGLATGPVKYWCQICGLLASLRNQREFLALSATIKGHQPAWLPTYPLVAG